MQSNTRTLTDVDFVNLVQDKGASELWLKYEGLTYGLSQLLFEELRLILLPTKAAQLK